METQKGWVKNTLKYRWTLKTLGKGTKLDIKGYILYGSISIESPE